MSLPDTKPKRVRDRRPRLKLEFSGFSQNRLLGGVRLRSPEGASPLKRRDFIKIIGGVTAAWPIMAHGQQAATPAIGFLSSRKFDEASKAAVSAFRKGLEQQGFIEGRNVTVHYVWADGHYDRLPALAADLAKQPLAAIIAAGGEPSAVAAKAATTTMPIVFTSVNDPVGLGLVASFNHPGGMSLDQACLQVW
jgi:putative ABC transport system substrate-binding protein